MEASARRVLRDGAPNATETHPIGPDEIGDRLVERAARPRSGIVLARLEEIDGDPYNVREKLTGIEELMESIARFGLLENLVAIEIPGPARDARGPWLELRAGSRRYEALRRLALEERWTDPVPVLVIDSEGTWENLVENIHRAPLAPWEIGRRLCEFQAAGMTNREIGQRLGHSNGWVSRYATIAQGLCPETIEYLTERNIDLKLGDLFRLAGIVDDRGNPDPKAQIAQVARAKKRRRRRRYNADNLRAFGSRMNYLSTQMPIPPLLRPVVGAVLQYIEHGGKPNFRALEEDLLDAKQRFLRTVE